MFSRFRSRGGVVVAVLVALGMVATGPAQALPAWRTAPYTYTNPDAVNPAIVNLRYAKHGSFDRVVIDVSGQRPSLKIRYVAALTYDGSGEPVPLTGKNKMALRFHPARAHDKDGNNLYKGPKLRQIDFPALRGVAFTGDFEGYVSFGFTTRTKPYRVFTLTDPSRIVIDWKHAG